jgi:phosphoserine phosphatase
VHPFAADKVDLAAELAARLGTNLELTTAYADSAHDLKLLEAVGSPVAVRPDAKLLRAARANAWAVIATQVRRTAARKPRAAERGYM